MKQLSWIGVISLVCCQMLNAEQLQLYIGNGTSEGIAKASLDTLTGEISEMKIVSPSHAPSFMVFSKGAKFCYTANKCKAEGKKSKLGEVSAYARSADGGLKLLGSQLTGGTNACHLSLDRTGSCLFVANYGSGNIASYKVSADGKLSSAVSMINHVGSGPNAKRQKAPHAHSIYVSPDNKFVYAADLGTDSVEVYKLNVESAELVKVSSAKCPAGSGPRHMCFSSDGSILYALNELKPSISLFNRDPQTGGLSIGKTTMLLGDGVEGISSSEIRLSDDGRFLYAANRDLKAEGRDSISILEVGANGLLKHLKNTPVGVSIPRHFDITNDGKMLVVAGQKGNAVVSFHRDPASGMIKPTGKKIEVNQPKWIGFVRP